MEQGDEAGWVEDSAERENLIDFERFNNLVT